jgi:tetratricopeptide (TPR) repeat protein
MPFVAAPRHLTLAVLAGAAVVALAGLGWFALRSPHSRFLPPDGAAEWVLYPVPPQVVINADRDGQRAAFRRRFELEEAPARAQLQVRAFTACTVRLNGRPIDLPGDEHWNRLRTADVAGHLRAGTNVLDVVVTNDVGPPALWLSLEGPGWSVASDDRWEVALDGAAECPAHPARQPLPLRCGNPAWGGDRAVQSLRDRLPTLLLFALLSAGALLLAPVAARRFAPLRLFGSNLSLLAVGLAAASLLWVLLLGHNTLRAPLFVSGFDAEEHLQYVQYFQEHGALPLADQGWEMHQPPLYYLLAAGLLAACGLSAADPGALVVLRLLGLAAGLAQLALAAACLRLLFPDRPRLQLAGLTLAAFLPAPLYLCHYVTNEALLMVLGTAALYLCLRALRDERPAAGPHALLGLCLGAALLTKVTAVVVAGVVLLVLVGRLAARRERAPGAWLRGPGVTLLVAVLVSGWHYARVWAHFGTPLVGNYDAASGFRFWQGPGYGSLGYLSRFGRSLTDPFFSAFDGLPDGLYSTLWGDGLCGGSGTWVNRPPWNYDLMAAGYLLALVPSLAVAAGLVVAVVELVRRPRAEWFLLLGVAAGLAVALLYQFLRYPYYGHVKAIYELTGAVPLCALGALGLGALARPGRAAAAALAVLLGTWACTAYAAFWVRPDAPATHNWAGVQLLALNRPREAEVRFRKAIAADPHFVPARINLANLLVRVNQRAWARQLIAEVLRDDPDDPDALFGLALFCQAEGRAEEALDRLRRVVELAPDYPGPHSVLGGLLLGQDRDEEAIAAYRQALRVNPSNAADHANLGLLLARAGRAEEALAQYRRALGLRPDQTGWMADLAWLLAAGEEPGLRDPAEALRLAEEACRLTQSRDPAALRSLAAAQAAAGRYPDALDTARQAAQVAALAKQGGLAAHIEEQVRRYEQGKPFYARAPFRTTPYPPVPALTVVEWKEFARERSDRPVQ